MRALCWLGLHDWRRITRTLEVWPQHRGDAISICARCGKRRH